MRMLPAGKRTTKARDARTPCAISILCRLSMKDCEGPPCPLPNPPLLLPPPPPNPPLLFDSPGPYSPPGPYCADTVVAALEYVSLCEQGSIRGQLPKASRAVLETSFIVSCVIKLASKSIVGSINIMEVKDKGRRSYLTSHSWRVSVYSTAPKVQPSGFTSSRQGVSDANDALRSR